MTNVLHDLGLKMTRKKCSTNNKESIQNKNCITFLKVRLPKVIEWDINNSLITIYVDLLNRD